MGVDIMGPLPRSTNQNEYLLVFVDYFTCWVELFPIRTATAKTVATVFKRGTNQMGSSRLSRI